MPLALSVRALSKSYQIGQQQETHSTLTESLLHKIRNPKQIFSPKKDTYRVLNNINFDISQGEVVGIIGKNGAGKSTLLKILSRITEPTLGEINLYGKIGSLLEVGTGFHPELTGRENIYLNGAILGMQKREINDHFDEIVDFSGVEIFLDTPVKRYSSGMYVRLAFAVAAHLRTDILIIDEVLAVGDAEFQQKCLGKMKDVAGGGRTVLFVSHNMAAVNSLCTRAIVLSGGTIQVDSNVEEATSVYFTHNVASKIGVIPAACKRSGNGDIILKSLGIQSISRDPLDVIPSGSSFQFVVQVEANRRHTGVRLSIDIDAREGYRITTLFSEFVDSIFDVEEGLNEFICQIESLQLLPETYFLNFYIANSHSLCDYVVHACQVEVVPNNLITKGRVPQREHGLTLTRFKWEKNDMHYPA